MSQDRLDAVTFTMVGREDTVTLGSTGHRAGELAPDRPVLTHASTADRVAELLRTRNALREAFRPRCYERPGGRALSPVL